MLRSLTITPPIIRWTGIGVVALMLGNMPAIAVSPYRRTTALPPVVRANPNAVQSPICFANLPANLANGGWQDLGYACAMGQEASATKTRKKMFDLTTDRDNDGVPDDIAAWLGKVDIAGRMSLNATPEQRLAQAAQQRDLFKELADRMPFNDQLRSGVRELGDLMYEGARLTMNGGPTDPVLEAKMARVFTLVEQIRKDPVGKKFDTYSTRYYQNKSSNEYKIQGKNATQ
jgi:hypothetical protein